VFAVNLFTEDVEDRLLDPVRGRSNGLAPQWSKFLTLRGSTDDTHLCKLAKKVKAKVEIERKN
jgi:hypothetical protein